MGSREQGEEPGRRRSGRRLAGLTTTSAPPPLFSSPTKACMRCKVGIVRCACSKPQGTVALHGYQAGCSQTTQHRGTISFSWPGQQQSWLAGGGPGRGASVSHGNPRPWPSLTQMCGCFMNASLGSNPGKGATATCPPPSGDTRPSRHSRRVAAPNSQQAQQPRRQPPPTSGRAHQLPPTLRRPSSRAWPHAWPHACMHACHKPPARRRWPASLPIQSNSIPPPPLCVTPSITPGKPCACAFFLQPCQGTSGFNVQARPPSGQHWHPADCPSQPSNSHPRPHAPTTRSSCSSCCAVTTPQPTQTRTN